MQINNIFLIKKIHFLKYFSIELHILQIFKYLNQMNKKDEIHLSKFLSLILRHNPQTIEIELDNWGWAKVSELLDKSQKHGIDLNEEKLNYIVSNCNKKRYDFNEDKSKIRANQGHSIKIELELKSVEPPKLLYHGTAQKNLESILKYGIDKRNRNHVHLSADVETAIKVGSRHGKVIVLLIDTIQMYKDGIQFYLSKNNVWLTDFIDKKYISILGK